MKEFDDSKGKIARSKRLSIDSTDLTGFEQTIVSNVRVSESKMSEGSNAFASMRMSVMVAREMNNKLRIFILASEKRKPSSCTIPRVFKTFDPRGRVVTNTL